MTPSQATDSRNPPNDNDLSDSTPPDYSPDYSGDAGGVSNERLKALADILRGLSAAEREMLRDILAEPREDAP